MEILVNTDGQCNADAATSSDGNPLFQIESSSSVPGEGSMVILRANPLLLPMVCGLCGSQYATAAELETHLDMHREGLPVKRGRGRPKGSKTKKPEDRTTAVPAPQTIRLEAGEGISRQNEGQLKKSDEELYIHGDKELDDLLRSEETFTKANLPQFTRDGVQIARLEDYVASTVVVMEKDKQSDGITATDVHQGGFLDSAMSESARENGETSTHIDGSLDVNEAMAAIIHNNDLSTAEQTGQGGEDMVMVAQMEQNTSNNHVTHIEVCLETFQNSESSNHEDVMVENQNASTKMCELCCVVLPSDKMRDHMVHTHMKGSSQEFHCPRVNCAQLFSTIPRLRQHLSTNHPTVSIMTPRVYPCMVPGCSSIHKSKQALRLHKADVHAEIAEASTTCHICHKVFKSKRAQSSHMKAHTKSLDPVKCTKCSKEFRHPSALKFHMSMMPNCDKPKYVCTLCGYKAVTPWRLNSHQKQVHSSSRPYKCEFCQKTYKTNEMLRQHTYKLHTGTPTFECEVCHKKFFYAAELREHSQLHNTSKKYICPICNRAFKTMHVFRGHMNGKHSDTWYSCGFCKFTTSHKKSMKRHMVLVHKLKNVTLEVTPEEPHQQVEVIQGDDIHALHLSDAGQVINSIQQIQYDGVGGVVIQNNSDLITNEQLAEEIIANQQMSSGTITQDQMDDESFRQLISNSHQTVVGVDDTMNASEVSEVLVSLSGAGAIDAAGIPAPAATDTVISTDS